MCNQLLEEQILYSSGESLSYDNLNHEVGSIEVTKKTEWTTIGLTLLGAILIPVFISSVGFAANYGSLQSTVNQVLVQQTMVMEEWKEMRNIVTDLRRFQDISGTRASAFMEKQNLILKTQQELKVAQGELQLEVTRLTTVMEMETRE